MWGVRCEQSPPACLLVERARQNAAGERMEGGQGKISVGESDVNTYPPAYF